MKRDLYVPSVSSFLSAEKDFELIISKMLKNENLKKLLYYNSSDCLSKPNVGQDETLAMLNKNIRIIPRLEIDDETLNYVIISFDGFTPNDNSQYRDNLVSFDIICHFDSWLLGDYQLRPYKIMGEIDGMLNNKHLSGIGTLQFVGGNQLLLGDTLGGFTLMYAAIHGKEDIKVLE